MADVSARLGLPLLAAGQAQKEVLHNEALAVLDLVVQARAEAIGLSTPPSDPAVGQCWVVGDGATDAWAGHADQLAGWTGSGWTFAPIPEGTVVWVKSEDMAARRTAVGWERTLAAAGFLVNGLQVVGPRGRPISGPTGGSTVDNEARAAISAILLMLKSHGLIGS